MTDNTVSWRFELFDGMSSTFKTIQKNLGGLQANMLKFSAYVEDLGSRFIRFNNLADGISRLNDSMKAGIAPGAEFQQQIADLQAITGIAGKDLESLSETSRNVGISSGLGASQAAEAFKLLASNIDISTIGGVEGLKKLQQETIALSKASGVDLTTAANTMSSTINQFGFKATEASRVINVLGAGAKYGAAEIPDLSESLKEAGASANQAGVSLESTVGALEVLSQNAVKGSEAGTGLRNVITLLQTKLGMDLSKMPLSDALSLLHPKLKDINFMTNTFGRENLATAQILISNSKAVGEMTEKVTGTQVAYEQAEIRSRTYGEEMKKIKARMDDLKISVFNVTGGFLPWVEIGSRSLVTISRMLPALAMMKDAFSFLSPMIAKASKATWGFLVNVGKSTLALLANGAVMLGSAIMSLGAYAAGTLGATMATWGFNAALMANPITWIIVGILALGAAIYGIVKYWDVIKMKISQFWDWLKNSVVKIGKWLLDHNPFMMLVNVLDKIFPGFKAKLKQFASYFYDNFIKPVIEPFKWVLRKIGLLGDEENKSKEKPYVESRKNLLTAEEIEKLPESEQQKLAEKYFGKGVDFKEAKKRYYSTTYATEGIDFDPNLQNGNFASGTGTVSGSVAAASTGKEVRNVSFKTESLVKNLTIQVTNLSESTGKIKDLISDALINGMRDAELALG